MSYRVPEHVRARSVQDEVMILDTRSGDYLGLNGTGAVIWTVLAGGGSGAAAVTELLTHYEVTRETAETDVAGLLEELLRLGLLTPASP